MVLGAFQRLGESILRRLGQDAFLHQGAVTTPVRANVEHGVAVTGSYDDATFVKDILTLPKAANAVIGDTVTVAGVTYTLDGLLNDNGVLVRYTVQQ